MQPEIIKPRDLAKDIIAPKSKSLAKVTEATANVASKTKKEQYEPSPIAASASYAQTAVRPEHTAVNSNLDALLDVSVSGVEQQVPRTRASRSTRTSRALSMSSPPVKPAVPAKKKKAKVEKRKKAAKSSAAGAKRSRNASVLTSPDFAFPSPGPAFPSPGPSLANDKRFRNMSFEEMQAMAIDEPLGAGQGQRGRSQSLECLEQWLYDQPANIIGGNDGMIFDALGEYASRTHQELEHGQGTNKRMRVGLGGNRRKAAKRLAVSSFKGAKRQKLDSELRLGEAGKILSQSFVLGGVGQGTEASMGGIKLERPLPAPHCGMASALCRMPLFTPEFRGY
jgi:hypothetical protein